MIWLAFLAGSGRFLRICPVRRQQESSGGREVGANGDVLLRPQGREPFGQGRLDALESIGTQR